jgi:hypothetical protein
VVFKWWTHTNLKDLGNMIAFTLLPFVRTYPTHVKKKRAEKEEEHHHLETGSIHTHT